MFENLLNKLEERVTHFSNQNIKPEMFSFEWFLVKISYLYGMGVWFRLWLYKKRFLKQKTLPCFVISIGNIAVGGTGKTPMAVYVAKVLKKMGKKIVVVSRGYKGNYQGDYAIVSDGNRLFLDAEQSGDEPYMMARKRSFPVVVGKDRFKAGMEAVNAFNPDIIVLDDGFQHLSLNRDFDCLLLDYSNPLGNMRLLPAGRLREMPQTSAQRADVLIFTRSSIKDDNDESIQQILGQYPYCPWFKTFHRPFIFKQVGSNLNLKKSQNDPGGLKGKRALLFSGIANNASFYQAMEELGINVLDHLEFNDHYRYKESDILKINQTAEKVSAQVILTTQKDWVKLDQDIKWAMDLIVIEIQIEFEDPQRFEALLISRLKSNE